MKTRIITGLIAVAIFLPILWYGSWPLVIGAATLGAIAMHEFFTMKKKRFFSLTGLISALTTIFIIVPIEYNPLIPNGITIWEMFFLFAMMLLVMTVLSNNEFTFDDAGVFLLASLYIGNGFHAFVRTAEMGFFIVLFVLLCVWATDVGAYFLGIRFGKHKLAPVISPNKSIEGSIGGMLASIIVAIIYLQFYNPINFSISAAIVLAILISIVGQLGDLTESAYKRYFGVKDSGKILPGHGGILDRFDSMLFVMPLFQIFINIYLNW